MSISDDIKGDPVGARLAIRAAFVEAGGSQRQAATNLGVHEATFSRWVHALGMREELVEIGDARGKRGPDKKPSRSRKKAQRLRRAKESKS